MEPTLIGVTDSIGTNYHYEIRGEMCGQDVFHEEGRGELQEAGKNHAEVFAR